MARHDDAPLQTPTPTISVVMAVKNAARYLRTALDSVMAQTYPVTEALLIDGQSTDETESIVRSYPRVRWMQESRITTPGYAAAWNDGIRAATTDPVAHARQRRLLDAGQAPPAGRGTSGRSGSAVWQSVTCSSSWNRATRSHRASMRSLLEQPHVAYMPGALLSWRSLLTRWGSIRRWTSPTTSSGSRA